MKTLQTKPYNNTNRKAPHRFFVLFLILVGQEYSNRQFFFTSEEKIEKRWYVLCFRECSVAMDPISDF